MTCQHPHPERDGVLCDKDAPCYGYHANAAAKAVWPGTPLPDTTEGAATRKGRLALIAQRMR